MKDKKQIRVYLKKMREKANLSQSDVAKALGYSSPQFISNWERGISEPPLDVLKRISNLYHLNTKELFEMVLDYHIEKTRQRIRREFYG